MFRFYFALQTYLFLLAFYKRLYLYFTSFFIKIQELDIDNCYILLYTVMRKEVKMDIIISNSSSIPIYEQLKKAIKQAILENELKEDDILPSVRSMANDLKISFLTVKKAYDELEKEGYIKTVQGKGSFVARKNSELLLEESKKVLQGYIEEIVKICKISI